MKNLLQEIKKLELPESPWEEQSRMIMVYNRALKEVSSIIKKRNSVQLKKSEKYIQKLDEWIKENSFEIGENISKAYAMIQLRKFAKFLDKEDESL